MKKLFIRLLIGLLIVVVLVVAGVALFLDTAIKKGVETIGPQITKVDVTLDGVNLSLLSGSAKIKGLVVGNPQGYKTPRAISVGTVSVAISPGSLLSDKIVVKSIHVEAPEITFEGGLGGNNLSKILDNVNASAGAGGGTAEKGAPKEQKPGKKLEVDDFLITGAKINVSLTGMGGNAAPIPLPDIHLTDLGKDSGGITPAELTKKILQAVTQSTVKAVANSAGNLGKGVLNTATGAGKTATDTVGKATKGITDLFKKKN